MKRAERLLPLLQIAMEAILFILFGVVLIYHTIHMNDLGCNPIILLGLEFLIQVLLTFGVYFTIKEYKDEQQRKR
ncbi:MAG: hypothetical protein NC035_08830 [Bacteroides sp.]|nr:hypothetical protein [Bacteroides sp.]